MDVIENGWNVVSNRATTHHERRSSFYRSYEYRLGSHILNSECGYPDEEGIPPRKKKPRRHVACLATSPLVVSFSVYLSYLPIRSKVIRLRSRI